MISIGKNDIYTFLDCPDRRGTYHGLDGCWKDHKAQYWVPSCNEILESRKCPRGYVR